MLTPDEIMQFVERGFVRLADAFPRELAEEARAILWRDARSRPARPHHVGEARDPGSAPIATRLS